MTMASLFDAINAAAAALNNAPEPPKGERREVKSGKSPIRVQPKVQPGAQAKVQPKLRVQPKGSTKPTPTEPVRPKVSPSATKAGTAAPKAQPKADSRPTPDPSRSGGEKKSKGQDFTGLFESYLRTMIEAHLEKTAKADPAFAAKMKAKGKSIEGCLNYIGEHFYRQAQKQRKSGWVGIGGDDRELCGMAVHYYDESEESLKSEKH